MDFPQTEIEPFLETFEFFNKNLPKQEVRRSFISIGSHLFINFGEEFESKLPNGRPYKKSPWAIWLGANVAWRLSQHGKFVVGSCQSYDQMNNDVQKLIGKKYLSCSITSQLMDIKFEFEDGYTLSSFWSVIIREQWTLFCSNGNNIGLEAEDLEQAKKIQKISRHFLIEDSFELLPLPIDQKKVSDFAVEGTDLYLYFEDGLSLCLDYCDWRVEKADQYVVGSGQFGLREKVDIHPYLNDIKEKKLLNSYISTPFKDAKFMFENGLTILTFSSVKSTKPWRVSKKGENDVYIATVSIKED